jgi:putative membrane protein
MTNHDREADPSEPHRPEREAEVREHLANERTLLAWVRTGVGLISVGFVVERAGAFATAVSGGESAAQASTAFGLALVALGCLALVVGAVQFFRTRRMILAGIFASTATPYMIVVAGSLLLAAAFIGYALLY